MGQSQSRPNTRGNNRHSSHAPVQASHDTTAAVDASNTADAPLNTLTSSTAPVVDVPVLASTNSTRPLSGRFSQFSMRSRRRSVAADELGQHRPPDVTRTAKRSWLGRIRSRTTSRSSAQAQQPAGSISVPPEQFTSTPAEVEFPTLAVPTPIDEPRPSPVAPVADGLTEGAAVQTPDSAPTTTPTSPTAQDQGPPDLGIPPPGSLIIVQGIVQTQDNAASQPNRAQSTPARGSRFFDRRRRSQQDVRPGTSESAQQSEFDPSASQTTTATGSEAPSAPDDTTNPAQISQSSIDVLGTLLSFATAATAASLVTGSISPLFSSGLTSAAAAGGEEARRDGSEEPRPRSVLNTMRERFRRRAAGGTEGSTDEMLGELSRAISQGLEIGRSEETASAAAAPLAATTSTGTTGSDSTTTTGSVPSLAAPEPSSDIPAAVSPPPSRPQTAQEPSPIASSPLLAQPEAQTSATPAAATPAADAAPSSGSRRRRTSARGGPRADAPEGSFERFLYNLQVDLRRALTEDQAARAANWDTASTAPSATASQGPDMPTTPTTPAGESTLGAGEQTPTDGVRRDGQVNWWRLYRFPPTRMPAGANVAGAEPRASPSAASPAAPSAATGAATPDATPAPGPASGSGAAATPAAERPLVVPVIVVGLQSVRPADLATAIPENVRQELENAVGGGANGAAAGTDRVRGSRTSRVLNRLSNLPPWRTNQAPGEDATTATDAVPSTPVTDPSSSTPSVAASGAPPAPTGGRTWLLYVIGGYFSLQHALVTGDVNSFEALWQLADLLGQVKPPVASKDDIERSGLAIFKAESLSDMLKEGKVAENCVDRCLICLEDYEASEDLRLMSCRHAFHQTCIDQWLLQGKNNCPACRAKGVSVQGDMPDGAAAADPAAAPNATPVASTSTTTPPTPGA